MTSPTVIKTKEITVQVDLKNTQSENFNLQLQHLGINVFDTLENVIVTDTVLSHRKSPPVIHIVTSDSDIVLKANGPKPPLPTLGQKESTLCHVVIESGDSFFYLKYSKNTGFYKIMRNDFPPDELKLVQLQLTFRRKSGFTELAA